jgi:hypothetical protein
MTLLTLLDTMPVSPGGQTLYERLEPLMQHDEENGWAGLYRCEAIAHMWQGLDQIVMDTDTHAGWTTIADPDATPANWLAWTAFLYGVPLIPGSPEQTQRDTIRELPPQKRATVEALIAAVKPTLTGTKEVDVVERVDHDAYRLDVLTRASETPNPSASEAAALSQKAAALIMEVSTSEPPIIDAFTRTIDSISAEIDKLTIADVT